MKEVAKMFLTFVIVFWLIVLHWLTFYIIDINIKAAIVIGVLLAHVDMFLISAFFVGYDKAQKKEESE